MRSSAEVTLSRSILVSSNLPLAWYQNILSSPRVVTVMRADLDGFGW